MAGASLPGVQVNPSLLGVATVVIGHAACSSPCERLRAHALGCEAAEVRYVPESESACAGIRKDVGKDHFDRFADCVTGSSCDDVDAVDRCAGKHVTGGVDDPCTHYRLWSAACGLEPAGFGPGGTGCGGVSSQSPAAPPLTFWVDCVTAGGCPTTGDDRYDTCQGSSGPSQLGTLIDACVLVQAWTTRCSQETSPIPVQPTSVPECLVQAQGFTAASYLDYGQCLSRTACDSASGRLACLLMLAPLQNDRIGAQCQALVAFTETCGSVVAGSTVEGCRRLFAGVTEASLDAYSACLTAGECGDPQAAARCATLLALP